MVPLLCGEQGVDLAGTPRQMREHRQQLQTEAKALSKSRKMIPKIRDELGGNLPEKKDLAQDLSQIGDGVTT